MLPPLFAAVAAPDAATSATSWVVVGVVAVLCSLGVSFITLIRLSSGKANERQIEPTQLAGLQAEMRANATSMQLELRTQTTTLQKLDREMGGVAASIAGFQRELTELKVTHSKDVEGLHTRIGGISRELASTTARVDGLEKREPQGLPSRPSRPLP